MNKRTAVALFSLLFLPVLCFGRSLSIQIIQNNPGQSKVLEASYFLEQCITDYFFDNGQIVSSSPIWISDTDAKNQSALKAALKENLEGGMDYLVRVEIFYAPSDEKANPYALLLENIKKVQWKIYLVKTGIEVSDGTALPESLSESKDSEAGLADFAGYIAYRISNGLRNLR